MTSSSQTKSAIQSLPLRGAASPRWAGAALLPWLAAALVAMALLAGAPAMAASQSQELVEKSRLSFEKLAVNEEFGPLVVQRMKSAKAVLIIPSLLKAGFGIGGEGGSGVLLAKRKDGSWSSPAFFTLGAGSIGIQIGFAQSEVVFMIMTDGGLEAVISNNAKLGGDVTLAGGPIGGNVEASTTTALGEDIFSYALSSGLFAGFSLEGAVMKNRADLDAEYYGPKATTRTILFEDTYNNAGAESLRRTLAAY